MTGFYYDITFQIAKISHLSTHECPFLRNSEFLKHFENYKIHALMSIWHSWKMNIEISVFAQKVNIAGNTEFVTHIWPRPFLWHSTISVVTFFFSSYLLSRRVTLENCSLFEAIYRNSKSHPCPFLTYFCRTNFLSVFVQKQIMYILKKNKMLQKCSLISSVWKKISLDLCFSKWLLF